MTSPDRAPITAPGDDTGSAAAPATPARSRSRRDFWVICVLAVTALILVGYLVISSGDPTSTAAPGPTATTAMTAGSVGPAPMGGGNQMGDPSASMSGPATADSTAGSAPERIGPLGDLARRTDGDPMAIGPVDAPVVMVVFSDFRCPFCAQFSRDTETGIVTQYVDSGQLRIEWRDDPIFGDQSVRAAVAGRAAAAQGRFWEFTRAVYQDAPETGHPDLPDTALIDYASQAGVPDIARFTADLTSQTALPAVQADLAQAETLQVPSTPAFIINGYPLIGSQPMSEFTRTINGALALAG